MRTSILTTLALVVIVPSARGQYSDECKYEAQRAVNMDAAGARMLELDAGAGSLRIEGKAGISRVTIRGRACASDRDLLDEIKLEARRDGDRVVVRANVHDRDMSWRNREYARLDVVMEVPQAMAATIDDGSGSIELLHLGNVDLDDGSGEIHGEDLGDVRIDDGSGEIELADIRGRVDIKDGSGEITLRNIAGAVDIDDGSGEINVRVAKGNVRISDSSGGISVADVSGDFIVDDDGSGGIDYDNVRGRVDIPRRKH